MYRGSSPIFDVPEFPPLRRVKPLPKRRRTSGEGLTVPDGTQYHPGMLPAEGPMDMTSFGLGMPLPQYYMPMFTGVQEMFRMDHEEPSLEYPGGFAVPVGGGVGDEEDMHGDGDYVDHLQQPGNTKKRKVPAAHHHSTGDGLSSPIMVEHDELDEQGQGMLTPGRTDTVEVTEATAVVAAVAVAGALLPLPARKNRTSAATLAGLQHKELLKTRKRQLAAVLGALSHGDTLALDQALSARYTSMVAQNKAGKENDLYEKQRRRWGRRKTTGWALMGPSEGPSEGPMDGAGVPVGEFTFACASPTSDRLVSTREEVAVLHSRFEAELSRQAAKATEVARQNAVGMEGAKRGGREQQRSRSSGTGNTNGDDETGGGGGNAKTRTSKKKKRSALANASNPHHLRNYVPSRMPHSGQGGVTATTTTTQNLVSPPAVRFLSAEIAPRRGKKTGGSTGAPLAPLGQPEEEWICALCEYNLFYGEETAFRRAVRSRKKILVRRRRAREKAAAAASGQKTGAGRVEKGAGDVIEDGVEGGVEGVEHKPVKHAGASKKERDKHA